MALLLEKNGLTNLRMLYGGYDGWIEAGFAPAPVTADLNLAK